MQISAGFSDLVWTFVLSESTSPPLKQNKWQTSNLLLTACDSFVSCRPSAYCVGIHQLEETRRIWTGLFTETHIWLLSNHQEDPPPPPPRTVSGFPQHPNSVSTIAGFNLIWRRQCLLNLHRTQQARYPARLQKRRIVPGGWSYRTRERERERGGGWTQTVSFKTFSTAVTEGVGQCSSTPGIRLWVVSCVCTMCITCQREKDVQGKQRETCLTWFWAWSRNV